MLMPAKISKTRKSKPNGVKAKTAKKPKSEKARMKLPSEDEEFRPPRIPKLLREETPKKKKNELPEEDVDSEPIYTDDYDNTIYTTEY